LDEIYIRAAQKHANVDAVVQIVDAAREYANTIFRNSFCIDWKIKRYRLGIAEPQKAGTDRAVNAEPLR
jgi:hypothetical protein